MCDLVFALNIFMKHTIETRYLWATPLFKTDISSSLVHSTLSEVQRLRDRATVEDPSGNWCSPDDLHTREAFAPMVSAAETFAAECLDQLTVVRDSVYISCMWANTAPVGVAHAIHGHSNSMYSGVVYLSAPPGSAGTVFVDPRPAAAVLVPQYASASPEVIGTNLVSPAQAGVMLLWPSWLQHGVHSTGSAAEHTRVSLSFNCMIRGRLGEATTHLDTRGCN